MVHKKNPTQTQSSFYGGLGKEKRLINNETFKVVFGLMNMTTSKYFADPSIYTITTSLNVGGDEGSNRVIPINIEVCSNDPSDAYYQATCFSKNQTHIDQLYISDANIASIEVTFQRCSSLTSNVTCASTNDINAKLSGSAWNIAYSVWSIDPTNFEQPISMESKDEWYAISLTSCKKLRFNLLAVEFTSDNGWLMPVKTVRNMITYENSQMDYFTDNYGDTFFIMNLQMSGNMVSYGREYEKIQNVLAQISGTMSLITIIVGLLALPYAKMKMYELLVNEAYNIVLKNQIRRPLSRSLRLEHRIRSKTEQVSEMSPNQKDKSKLATTRNRFMTVQVKPSFSASISASASLSSKILLVSRGNTLKPEHDNFGTDVQVEQSPNIMKVSEQSPSISFRPVESLKIDESQSQKEINTPIDFQEIQNNSKQQVEDYHEESTFHFLKDQNSANKCIQDPNDSLISSPLDISNVCQNIDDLQNHQSSELANIDNEGTKKDEETDSKPSPLEDINLEVNKDLERTVDNVDIERRVTRNKTRAEKLVRKSTTFQQWLVSQFKPSMRSKALTKGRTEILKHVDMFSIIRRFQEIDNLKACLLTDQQRIIFDNIAKPCLVVDPELQPKDTDFITVNGWNESYRGNQELLYEAYRDLKHSEVMTEVDRHVLELYETSLNNREYAEMESLL